MRLLLALHSGFVHYGGHVVDFRGYPHPHGSCRQAAARSGRLQLADVGRAQRHLILDDFGIERGTKSPTVITVVRLAQALGVSAAALIGGGTEPAPRIRVLRCGEGAGGEHPARWESLGPAAPGSRIDFVRYQITPSTVLGPSTAHAPGTVEHVHVATGTVRVTVGDETAELAAGDSCSCRTDVPHGVENPDPSAEALIYLIVERG
jgi:quercetin dioxygenase-like cupin family protein